ncbi:MAG: hypothetical protein LUQ15_07165, partial [Methanothrix sp.]|nr:hypothetical protein [Methanothrix sp.]
MIVMEDASDKGMTAAAWEEIKSRWPGKFRDQERFIFQEMQTLHDLGANEVIPEEYETSIEIFARVLDR